MCTSYLKKNIRLKNILKNTFFSTATTYTYKQNVKGHWL